MLTKLIKVFSSFFIYFLLYCCIVSTIIVNTDEYLLFAASVNPQWTKVFCAALFKFLTPT